MKREDLKKMGLTDEQIDLVMAENGKDIEAQKTKTTSAETAAKTAADQLVEANKQIEGFKAMKVEDIQKAADDYKAKFEQAQKDAEAQVSALKFDHALEAALTGAKAKNGKAVRALLDASLLKLADDGSISGLKEQLDKIKSENDFLFEAESGDPKIVTKTNNKTVLNDPFMAAVLKGAGMPPSGDEK